MVPFRGVTNSHYLSFSFFLTDDVIGKIHPDSRNQQSKGQGELERNTALSPATWVSRTSFHDDSYAGSELSFLGYICAFVSSVASLNTKRAMCDCDDGQNYNHRGAFNRSEPKTLPAFSSP